MTRIALLFLAAFGIGWFPSTASAGGDEAHVQYTRVGELAGEPTVETYEVVDPMRTLVVSVDLELESGAADWRLTAPDGDTAWEGRQEAGDAKAAVEEKTFEATAGTWTLTVTPDAADGSYRIRWRGDS